MAYENILVETVEGGVGVVTLNRPKVLNALSYALASELDEALTDFEDDHDDRCVVITGAGEKAFSAGADIHEMVDMSPRTLAERQRRPGHLHLAPRHAEEADHRRDQRAGLRRRGAALKLARHPDRLRALQLPLPGRYRTAGSTAPGRCRWSSAGRAPRSCSTPPASSRPTKPLQIGLLNKVVPVDQLLDAAIEMGRQIAGNTPEMVQGIKQILLEDVGRAWRADVRGRARGARAPPTSRAPSPRDSKTFLEPQGATKTARRSGGRGRPMAGCLDGSASWSWRATRPGHAAA